MPWKSQGGGGSGGPWGDGPSGGGGPWGGGGGPGGPRPPDFEDFIRKGQDRIRRLVPGGLGSGIGLVVVIAVVLVLWGLSGLYRVQPGEQGVEMLFGRWSNQASLSQPGLHLYFPYPIGSVETPQVEQVRQIDIGFRRRGGSSGGTASRKSTSGRSRYGERICTPTCRL
jgi:membrane protease subunit HflK